MEKLALDVKVVNALGRSYIDATRSDPLAATEVYHDKAMEHDQTAARCAAMGITYVPMVFTAQGGMGKRAEAVLHQLAEKVAPLEQKTPTQAFGEVVTEISRRLAGHAARSMLRRGGMRRAVGTADEATRHLWEVVQKEEETTADDAADEATELPPAMED